MSMEQNPIAKWPFGAATIIMLAVAAGATDIEIINNMTIVDGEDVISTGDRTLNLLIANDVEPGARLIVKNKTTGAESLIPGNGMSGTTISGVSGKTKVVEYVYDGKNFIQTAAAVQID